MAGAENAHAAKSLRMAKAGWQVRVYGSLCEAVKRARAGSTRGAGRITIL